MTDVYLRNRIAIEPIVNGKSTSLEQVYTRKLSSISYMRVFEYKCIAYVSLDLYSNDIRRDKLMPRERKAILIRFNTKTTKQYRIYALDLGRCIKSSTIIFFEDIKGGEIDLKLRTFISNELIIRNSIRRPSVSIDLGQMLLRPTEEASLKSSQVIDQIALGSTAESPHSNSDSNLSKPPVVSSTDPLKEYTSSRPKENSPISPTQPPILSVLAPKPPRYIPRSQTALISTSARLNANTASIP